MLQAFTTPALKSILFAGLGLGLVGFYSSMTSHPVTHRLALHAIEEPDTVYLTAWRAGDVRVKFDSAELRAITFKTRAIVYDCDAIGTETLVPINDHVFAYDYREQVLSCAPGVKPPRKTPRTGLVTVED